MPSLILTLPASLPSAAPPCAAVWTADGHTVLRQTEAPLALLKPDEGTDTIVVVAHDQLSWHQLELPSGTLSRSGDGARLRAVLQGLLEERVLDDVDTLHLALQPQAMNGAPVWVSVCQRSWLKTWLDALEQAGHRVSRIVPVCHPVLSGEPARWRAMGPQDHPSVLVCSEQGVVQMPLGNASLGLLDSAAPNTASVLAEPSVVELAEHHFPGCVQLQTSAECALQAARGDWDLAQFDLVRTRSTRLRKQIGAAAQAVLQAPQWRPARWALVALVVINLVGIQAWAWKEQSALVTKREAIRSILTSTFPEVRLVVDAPVQMARALADLQRQNGAAAQSDLETMLGQFHVAAPESTAPTAIEFVANELRLQGTGINSDTLNDLNLRMQGVGYRARLEGDQLVVRAEGMR